VALTGREGLPAEGGFESLLRHWAAISRVDVLIPKESATGGNHGSHVWEIDMGKSAPAGLKVLLALNCVALIGFVLVLAVQPAMTVVDVCMNYTELDREGVINNDVLAKVRPDYAQNPRNAVPRYIAGAALQGQRVNAQLGVALAAVNALVVVGFLLAAEAGGRPAGCIHVGRTMGSNGQETTGCGMREKRSAPGREVSLLADLRLDSACCCASGGRGV